MEEPTLADTDFELVVRLDISRDIISEILQALIIVCPARGKNIVSYAFAVYFPYKNSARSERYFRFRDAFRVGGKAL